MTNEDNMSPVQFGRMQAELESLRRDLEAMQANVTSMVATLDAIKSTLSEAKGGWRIMMLVGGGAATVGAAVSHALHVLAFIPK